MARARGANAVMALAFETVYGVPPTSGFRKMPFVSSNLGEEQGLLESDLLGYGRDPQEPGTDVANDEGDVVVPLDLRNFGYWLKLLLGAPTSTVGLPATGSYVLSAQPADGGVLTINGQAVTFVASAPAANEVLIGATLADTLANAVIALNASVVAGVAAATYSTDLTGTAILITHDTIGPGGNSFTIVAGSAPATNATASGATLSGGSASGPTNHVFVGGAQSLPSGSVEIGLPEVPSFGMNFGGVANTLSIDLQRSGQLNATIGMICQGENPPEPSTAAGTPSESAVTRFNQFTGHVTRDGVTLGDVVSGKFSLSNNLDKVEVIRPDGRIAGADPGMLMAGVEIAVRFGDHKLLDLATAGTPVELVFQWTISATKRLRIAVHNARLPKPKRPITGPGGVQATFAGMGSKHPTLGKTLTVTLINDVASY